MFFVAAKLEGTWFEIDDVLAARECTMVFRGRRRAGDDTPVVLKISSAATRSLVTECDILKRLRGLEGVVQMTIEVLCVVHQCGCMNLTLLTCSLRVVVSIVICVTA